MKIGIDITPLSNGEKTGIGMYVNSLLYFLAMIDSENHYFLLYGQKNQLPIIPIYGQNFKIVSFYRTKEFLSYQFNLNKIIKQLNLNVLHCTATIGCPPNPSVPVISTVHDIFPVKYKTTSCFKLLYRVMSKNLVTYSSHYIYDSFGSENDFCNFYGTSRESGSITYLGPSFIHTAQKRREKNGPIICIGAIEKRKNQLFLLKTYMKALSLNSELPSLIFIGPIRDRKIKFKEIIKNFNSSKIKWLNYISDEELQESYKSASLMLYPSIDEGFGIPLVDAMNCSLPVICSDIPIFREIGEDYPIFAKLSDEKDWIEKILSFYSSAYPDMQEKSKKLMLNYSWEKCARETLECYKKVAGYKL